MNKKIAAILIFTLVFKINLWAKTADENLTINIDSLENVLLTNQLSGEALLAVYWDLSNNYVYADNHEKTMYYSRKGIALAEETNNLCIAADLYNNLGISYDFISQSDSAMLYYEKALELVTQMEKEKTEKPDRIAKVKASVYGSIANLYCVQGKTDEALAYYFMALKLLEQHGITYEIAVILGNISVTYFNIDNYEQSEIYLLKKEKICRENGYEISLAHTLTNLGATYDRLQKKDKAIAVTEEALSIYQKHNSHTIHQITCYINLSSIHLEDFGDDVKAMEYAELALKTAKDLDIPRQICYSLMQQSYIYLFQKNYVAAEKSALEALQTDSTSLSINQLLYESIAKAYIGMGNTDKANTYFDRFKQSQTTYANENFQEKLSEMEVKYETEKKELRISILEDEKRLMMWLTITGGSVLLLGLTALLLLWKWTVQKKRLAEKLKQLAEQQIIQLEQEKQLIATQAVLDGETTERTRIARDLHDGLGGMLSVVRLNLDEMKESATVGQNEIIRFNRAIGLLDDSIEEMRRVAHHLMPDALSRFGLKTALTDFLNVVPHVEFNYFGEDGRIDNKLEVVVYRIIHELVTNALKHAAASQILVQVIRETDRIALTVEDNGRGFDPELIDSGAGLQNIRTRVASFGGTIDMRTQKGIGTEVNVEFLIHN